jgi:hypothetical protein
MSEDVASLIVEIKSKDALLAKSRLDDLSKTGGKLDQKLQKMSSAAKKFGLAVSAATAAAAFLVSKQIDAADNMQKLSIRTGESTEALSQYAHVADITGVSFEDIANSFAKMQKNLADASDGTGTATTALEKLNINVDDLINLKPAEQFELIADAISLIESPTQRTQIAMDLMGRSGSRMLSTMAEGGEGIRKIRKEFDLMGGTLSQVDANQIASTNDSITNMWEQLDITAKTLTIAVSPALKVMAEDLTFVFRKMTTFNDQLKLFFATHGYSDTGKLIDKLAELTDKRAESESRLNKLIESGIQRKNNERVFQQEENLLRVLGMQIQAMQERAGIAIPRMVVPITEAAGEKAPEDDNAHVKLQESVAIEDEKNQLLYDSYQTYLDRITRAEDKKNQKIIQLETVKNNTISAMQSSLANNTVSLLAYVGRKNKIAAIAAIALEKGMAIATIAAETLKGQTAARAWGMITLNPVAGEAAALRLGIMGGINAAAVAGLGLLQASSVVSGGGGVGVGVSGGNSGGGGPSLPETLQQREEKQPDTYILQFGTDAASKITKVGLTHAIGSDGMVMDIDETTNFIRVVEV